MKKLIFISSLFIIAIFFSQCSQENNDEIEQIKNLENVVDATPSTRLKDKDCLPPPLECEFTSFSGDATYIVQDSQFGCDISVTYYVQYCVGSNQVMDYFNISNLRWSIDYSNSDCIALYNYAMGLFYGSNGPEALAAYVEQLENEITHSWELAFMDGFVSNVGPSTYYCGNSTPINIISELYKSTCYRYCFDFSSGGEGGHGGPFVTKLKCGTGCCKRSTTRCLDPITHNWIETVTFEQTQDCNYDPDPWPGCGGFATDCIFGSCAE